MGRQPNVRLGYLKKVMGIQSKSYNQENMIQFIENEINELNDSTIDVVIDDDNIYVTKGNADTYPCAVSHMDTVHMIIDGYKVYHHKDALFSINTETYGRTGIGGDDKVGIFICLELLSKFDDIKIAFFRDEEVGCVGSGASNMDFFDDVSFILQADRKGYADFVSKIHGDSLYSNEFSLAIKDTLDTYGKKEVTNGGLTDVYKLKSRGLGVCVANVSCGYYLPHTSNEYIIISEVFATSDLFSDLITTLYNNGSKWEHVIKKPVVKQTTTYFKRSTHHSDTKLNWWEGEENQTKHEATCGKCKGDITDFYDKTEDGYYCPVCNEYRYLPDTQHTINSDIPDNSIIHDTIINYYKKRKRNKKRRL